MKHTFDVNGKQYTAAKMDFNTIADLSELGVDMISGELPVMSTVRAYFAVCAGISKSSAGNELNKHISSGGDLSALLGAFKAECEESGFTNPAKRPATKVEEVEN